MIRKTAVIIRGQPRTWNFLAEHTINLIDETYNRPDWFLVFSQSSTVNEELLKKQFANSNLISVQFLEDKNYRIYSMDNDAARWGKFPPAYFRQAYFEYFGGLAKREHELRTGSRYEEVFVARPDCYFFPCIVPRAIFLERQDIVGYSSSLESEKDLTGADFQFLAGSIAADQMSFRYYDTAFTDGLDNQAIHPGDLESPQYYIKKNLIMQPETKTGALGSLVVRPSHLDHLPFKTDFESKDLYRGIMEQWDESPAETRISVCQQHQIDPQDYFLIKNYTKQA